MDDQDHESVAQAGRGLGDGREVVARLDAMTGRLLAAPVFERVLGLADGALAGVDLLDVVSATSTAKLVSTMTVLLDQPGTTRALHLEVSGPGGETAIVAVLARCENTPGDTAIVTFSRAVEPAPWLAPQRDQLADRAALTAALEVAQARDEVPTVVAVKIENLDSIEAAFGEHAFDQLIDQIGARISENVESVRAHALLGASTMGVLLVEAWSSTRGPLATGNMIRDLLSLPFDLGGTDVFLFARLAVGVGLTGQPEAALRSTLRAVERLSGPTMVQVVDRPDRDEATREVHLRNELRFAVERDELRLVFQPYVDAQTGLIAGAEALVRWEHPTLGRLGPVEFIPLAEETNFIDALGGWVLRAATSRLKQWRRLEMVPSTFVISVNVSPRQLINTTTLETVGDALATAGLDPTALCCEITETALLADDALIDRMLRGLVDSGVQIAIDDFGTGYATLDYLQRVPASILKIDRQFIQPLPEDASGIELVRGIIDLAHTIGKSVVAEGVETAEQATTLRELDCDFLQGYWVSHPLDDVHFSSLMTATAGVSLLDLPETTSTERAHQRVVIVDAELAIVGAMRAALEASDGLQVAGTATSIREAIELVRRVQPDVIVSERVLPDGDAVEEAGRYAEAAPGAAILIFTSRPDERSLARALASGVRGYVDKQSTFAELVAAIREVSGGEVCIAPRLQILLSRRENSDDGAALTDRELDVLAMLARGSSTNEMADELFLSVHTIRNHIARVLRKLGARTRLEAVAIATDREIVSR